MVVNEIVFDVWTNNYIMVYARKGEINARSIVAAFQNEQEEYLDLTGKSVTFYALKPDGTKIYNSCTINTSDKTATIDLTSQVVSVAGIVNCEYQIYSGNTLLLKVSGLKIVVEDGGDFSEAVESSSEYNTLINAINEAESFSESVGSVSDLTTSDKSTVVAAVNEVNGILPDILKGTSLWGSSSGYNGTITLSDDYSNYDFIYLQGKNAGIATANIFRPATTSKVSITNLYANDTSSVTGMNYRGAVLEFSGTTVTWSRNGSYAIKKSSSADDVWTPSGTNDAGIWLTKIVGFKY